MRDRALTRLFLRFRDRRDGRALARLFDRTAPELLRVAAHLAQEASEAEDLVQETFLTAIRRADAFDGGREVKPWLYGILAHEAAKRRDAVARAPGPDGRHGRHGRAVEADPASELAARELPKVVAQALGRMHPRYRDVLEPFLLRGQRAEDIARDLGRAPGTVRMQIHRGLERLRRALPAGIALGAASVLHTRGLEVVRREVLRAARFPTWTAAGSAVLPLATAGLLVPTKFLVGSAALFLVAIGIWSGLGPTRPVAPAIHESTAPAPAIRSVEVPPAPGRRRSSAAMDGTPVTVSAEGTAEGQDASARSELGVRVLDGNGRAVRDAEVVESSATVRGRTDEAGELRILVEEELSLFARAPGRVPSLERRVGPSTADEPGLELRLRGPAVRLRVEVRAQGEPVAGAEVRAESQPGPILLADGTTAKPPPEPSATTDARGEARLEGLPAGRLAVWVRAQGYCPSQGEAVLEPGLENELQVDLDPGQVLVGRAVDESGAPVAGAWVSAILREYSPLNVSTRTDPDGRYRLAGIASTRFTAAASERNLGRVEEELEVLTRGQPLVWNPLIQPHPGLSGRVVDERGAPLAGWNVLLHEPGSPQVWLQSLQTDEDGHFAFRGTPDGPFHLSVRTPALWDGGSIVLRDDVQAGDQAVEIVVPDAALPSATLRGHLVYRSGRIPPAGRVMYQEVGDELSFATEYDPGTGAFEAGPLRPRTYTLGVLGTGLYLGEELERRIELHPEEVLDVGLLELDDPGTLLVAVEVPESPLRGSLQFQLTRSSTEKGRGGSMILAAPLPDSLELPPGRYELVTRASHYRADPQNFEMQSGGRVPIEIALEPMRLRIEFVPAQGTSPGNGPLEALDVTVSDRPDAPITSRHQVVPDASGALLLVLDREPGLVLVTATASDGRRGRLHTNWGSYSPRTFEVAVGDP